MIYRMQSDIKKIQLDEYNLKTIEYLNTQRNEIYEPLCTILIKLKSISKYIMQINNIPSMDKIESLERDIEKITRSSEPINQKDFEKINLIKNIYSDIIANNCNTYKNEKIVPLSEDDMNLFRFDLISQFVKYYHKVDKDTKTQIDIIRSQDIFQYKMDKLIFKNGLIYIDNFLDLSKFVDDMKDSDDKEIEKIKLEIEKVNHLNYEIQKKYSSKDLIPILTIFFENQLIYFTKIKNGIDEKLDEMIPVDVSKFADEN